MESLQRDLGYLRVIERASLVSFHRFALTRWAGLGLWRGERRGLQPAPGSVERPILLTALSLPGTATCNHICSLPNLVWTELHRADTGCLAHRQGFTDSL